MKKMKVKKTFPRILTWVLSLIMIFTMMPGMVLTAFAEGEEPPEDPGEPIGSIEEEEEQASDPEVEEPAPDVEEEEPAPDEGGSLSPQDGGLSAFGDITGAFIDLNLRGAIIDKIESILGSTISGVIDSADA